MHGSGRRSSLTCVTPTGAASLKIELCKAEVYDAFITRVLRITVKFTLYIYKKISNSTPIRAGLSNPLVRMIFCATRITKKARTFSGRQRRRQAAPGEESRGEIDARLARLRDVQLPIPQHLVRMGVRVRVRVRVS